MASKRKAPAKKKAPSKGNINVDVTVDLVGTTLTKQQQAHLRSLVKSQVLTWVKDVGAPVPVIICDEHGPLPPDDGE
jgi:uncharacterized protein (DUF1499 family)